MKMKRGQLMVLVAVAVALIAGIASGAVWNQEEAVHVTPSDIENSTLVIGTHLIHLSGLTNTLYEIATASAGESGQEKVFYKSELAGGAWFDISTASALTDITTGGLPVGDDVIEALFLTHHTKSDGVTYDLRTGNAVSIFDIRDPYDLESMDELFPLKTQLDITIEMQSESAYGAAKLALMNEFFATEVNNTATAEYDSALAALQAYYNVIKDNGGGEAEVEAVQGVMDAVDAARRAEVLRIVDQALQSLARKLQEVADTEGTEATEDEEGSEGSEGSAADPELKTAVNDSLSNISEAYIKQSGKMLDEGATVMSAARYDACMRLISDAKAPDHASCDADVTEIISLDNILNGIVAAKEAEAALLDRPLLPNATDLYTKRLAGGMDAEYIAAVGSNAAAALKNGIVRKNKSLLTIYRSELEFFIEARCLRLDNAAAIEFIDARLDQATGFHAVIPRDDYFESAGESVDEHIEFLTGLRRKFELAAGGNENDKLKVEKAALQTALLSALDNNDLALAKELEGQIAAIDDQMLANQEAAMAAAADLRDKIDDLQDQLDGAVAADDQSRADSLSRALSQARAELSEILKSMSEGSVGSLVSELRSDCLDIIANGGADEMGTLLSNVDALGGLLDPNFKAVFPVLQELHDAMTKKRDLEDNASFDAAISAIEAYILDNKAAYDLAMMPALTDKDFERIAQEFFAGGTALFDPGILGGGSDLSGLSEDERAVVFILALKLYAEQTGDQTAEALMRARAQRQYELGSYLVYPAIMDSASRYLPAPSIAKYLNMRYVWNQNENEGTLARGGTYYYYTVYSTTVLTGRGRQDVSYMASPARFRYSVHLPDDYTYETFGVWAVYVPGTDYGVLVSERLDGRAAELFSLFLSQ